MYLTTPQYGLRPASFAPSWPYQLPPAMYLQSAHSVPAKAPVDSTSAAGDDTPSPSESIDSIVARGSFPVPAADPIEALLGDRRQTAHLTLDDAIAQIRSRYEVYYRNLYEIENAKCEARRQLVTWFDMPNIVNADVRENLHKIFQDLYHQQRDERIHLWRDVSRLRSQLPEAIREYLSSVRRASILESGPGDAL